MLFYWFNTTIDVFVKYSENWYFSHFLIDGPVQCYPEKAILMKHTFQIRCFGWMKVCMWKEKGNVVWKKDCLEGEPLCASLMISGFKNSSIINW